MTTYPQVILAALLQTLESGGRPSGGATDEADGVFSLGGEHIRADGDLDFSTPRYIPRSFYEELNKGKVRQSDVLVVKDGATTGKTALVDDRFPFKEAAVNEHVFILRVEKNLVLPAFLASFLQSEFGQTQILASFQGAAIGGINREFARRLKVPLPPLSEQRRIVQALQEAEAVRRLHAQADRKTAELIPAIFHEMFGDPEANPKGWPTKALSRLLVEEPQNGLYKPSTEYGSGTPIIRITDFYDGRLTTKELQRVRVSEAEAANYRVDEGNILVNRVNSMEFLGKSALVQHLAEPTIFESNMMRLNLDNDQVAGQFLIEFLQTPAALGRLRRRAKHAVNQASVNQGDVTSLSVIVPPLELQQRFAHIVLDCRSLTMTGEANGNLEQELLDSLLSHAFSGELTTNWREHHARELAEEANARDEALKAAGMPASRPATAEEIEAIYTTPVEGQWSELNAEQRELWQYIPFEPFTTLSLARNVRGFLRNRADAIRRHLDVFCARGLLLSVSRERTDDDGGTQFAQLYRRPTEKEKQWREAEMERLAQSLATKKP